ncbi:MAG: zinc/iron-chelating domain-containing protein [Humidesulfovibrio sp.]|uniref:zinc/iron-chelating domain-containing protein n=1 Tax=Humidesulfovibrio sp. TaxID=2910988 RepID=UPI00273715E2|nr:zinc/iron-chelating domain-containing protein [Humidesulfovibrio sp.]MDP2847297.1 zinc/iron-chelating domain-containing protein [Humidesulfovibrio sp.]
MDTDAGSDSDVCARCGEQNGSCCTLVPGQEEYCFPLSADERAVMEKAGAKPEHFFRQHNTQPFLDNLNRLFPNEADCINSLFPPDGSHDRLAITPQGSCELLGSAGCGLPRQSRPYYCLLYPFWLRHGRELYFESSNCQAQREAGGGGAGLMRRLNMTSADIRRTYRELRRAWGLPEQR